MTAPLPSPARPIEIEPLSNRFLVHRLSHALLPLAVRAGIAPNAVSVAGLILGLGAAACYFHWREPTLALLGFTLMIGWHVLDGLDGALARATGRATAIGRVVDGVADYATFVAVHLALALSFVPPWTAVAAAMIAGAGHVAQSAFYEGARETYARRVAGRFRATPRPAAGGWIAWGHNRLEAVAANRETAFDAAMTQASSARGALLMAQWRPRAARTLLALSLLSANARTIGIFLCCLLATPFWFWAGEAILLSLVALAGARGLRQAEEKALAFAASDRGEVG
jgi:phosphatidylglycerophosphate synthase